MAPTFSHEEIHQILKAHLNSDELGYPWHYPYAESWVSPGVGKRIWESKDEELPLRFHLKIDMQA